MGRRPAVTIEGTSVDHRVDVGPVQKEVHDREGLDDGLSKVRFREFEYKVIYLSPR